MFLPSGADHASIRRIFFLKSFFFCNPCLGLFGSLRFGVIIDLSFAFKKHMFFVCLNPFQNPAWISRIDLVLVFANQNFPLVFNPILESQVIMCGFFFDNCHLVMSPFEVQFAYKKLVYSTCNLRVKTS